MSKERENDGAGVKIEITGPGVPRLIEHLRPFVGEVLKAKARARVERERVNEIKRRIISEEKFMILQDGEWSRLERIEDIWKMSGDDYDRLLDRVKAENERAGYNSTLGYFPDLPAEDHQRQVERRLIKEADVIAGVGFSVWRRYVDILTDLVVNHEDEDKSTLTDSD